MRTAMFIGFLLVAPLGAPLGAAAEEGAYIDRFGGSWSGGGIVIRNDMSFDVTCKASGQPGDNRITIEGDCGIAIARMRIAADITYDPATGRYSGVYTGARVGPARVSGTRSGNVVNLTITWPQPVNGDTRAAMRIENAGGGNLRIVVSDNDEPGGPDKLTHDLLLSQL